MENNAIEIILDVLNYIQGEIFNDAKVVNIGNYSNKNYAYVDLQCRNKDKIKITIDYEPHVEEQSDVEE